MSPQGRHTPFTAEITTDWRVVFSVTDRVTVHKLFLTCVRRLFSSWQTVWIRVSYRNYPSPFIGNLACPDSHQSNKPAAQSHTRLFNVYTQNLAQVFPAEKWGRWQPEPMFNLNTIRIFMSIRDGLMEWYIFCSPVHCRKHFTSQKTLISLLFPSSLQQPRFSHLALLSTRVFQFHTDQTNEHLKWHHGGFLTSDLSLRCCRSTLSWPTPRAI